MRLCNALYLLATLTCIGHAATVESTDLSRHLVFFERAASQSDTDLVYWVRGFELSPRLTGNAFLLNPGLGTTPVQFRFSDGAPARREGPGAGFALHEFRGAKDSWRRNIGNWKAVQYLAARPGVDVEFSVRPDLSGIEMTAVVAPGAAHYVEADASASLQVSGQRAIVSDGWGTISMDLPSAWQIRDGQRITVEAQFLSLTSRRIAIQPGTYDRALPLYLSARLPIRTAAGFGAALRPPDGTGDLYVAGGMESLTRCRTTSGGRAVYCGDPWIAKFRANGEPVFLTRLTGEYDDQISATAMALNGDVLVVGYSDSADFPATADALQPTNAGPTGQRAIFLGAPVRGDGFVSRLDGATGELLYSTFYGLPDTEEKVTSLAVSNDVLIAINGRSLALLDAKLGRRLATKDTAEAAITQMSLAGNGEATYGIGDSGMLVRLGPNLGEPRYRFGLGYRDRSYLGTMLVLPGGGTLVGWTQRATLNSSSIAYLSEISPDGQRELWRTEVGLAAIDSIHRAASGDIFLLLQSSGPSVATTPDAIQPAPCTNSVVLQRYSATGDLRYSSYLPPQIPRLSGIALDGPESINGVDGVALHRIRFDQPTPAGIACMTDAATRAATNYIAPGKIMTLIGSGFGGAGTEVYVNHVRAPLLYVGNGQINAVMPYEGVMPGGTATIEVRPPAATPMTTTSEVVAAAAEIFTMDATGFGQAAAFNQDGTLNSEQRPAAIGSIVVLYGTGIGQTVPASVTGAVAPISGPGALARPQNAVTARIGSVPAEVLYAGAAPGLINGAAQFNLRVPATSYSGRHTVQVFVGNAPSSASATIWIQGVN